MPIFEYNCAKCKENFEAILINKNAIEMKCPKCGKMCPKIVPTKMTFHLLGRCWSGDGFTHESEERKKSLKNKKYWDQIKKKKKIETPKGPK